MNGPGPVDQSDLARLANERWDHYQRELALTAAGVPSANTGTLDPTVCQLLRGAARIGELASEPEHFREGYVAGHRAGVGRGILLGAVLGGLMVAGALQAGWWWGGGL